MSSKLSFWLLVFSFLLPSWGHSSGLSCRLKSRQGLTKLELKISGDASEMAATLSAKGFSCDRPAPSYERGVRCRGKLAGYPEAVNIFIPSQFEKKNSLPVALHFHGHNTGCERGTPECHFNVSNGDGDYGKFLTDSGANTLLVMPESQGRDDTFKNYFKKPQDLDHLMDAVKETVGIQSWDSLSLSSHSGGDAVMERLARWYESGQKGALLQKLQSVALFDSLYADREGIALWPAAMKKENPSSRFLGSYVVGPGASTVKHMKWLRARVPDTEQWQFREVRSSHMAIMKEGGMSDYLRDSCK